MHRYRFNNIDSARYEQFEKLPPALASDPEVIHFWGDRYWQLIPRFVIDDLREVAGSYDSEVGESMKAREGWVAGDFREAVAEKLRRENGVRVDDPRREIGTCHGAADGFACVTGIFLRPGDEVLVFDPQFTFAWGLCDLAGAKTIPVPLKEEDGWNLQPGDVPDLLEPLITEKTRMMIMCMPGNPTGTAFSRETTRAVGDILSRHGILYLEDSVYERRLYDGAEYVPMETVDGMRDLTISVKGFSKVYNVQDFRVGYIHANPEVIRRVWRWHMLGGIDPSNIFMKTMAKALRRDMAGPLPPPWHEAYRREWDAVRRSSYEALREIPGVSLALPEAGTYHFVNISRLGSTDEVFTLLRDKYKVTVTPGTWYGPGGEGYLRLCYAANTPEVTEAGLERVAEALTKLAEAKGIN